MINRWVILGVSVFVSIAVIGFYFSTRSWFALEVISFFSILCFLGLFVVVYVSSGFRSAVNPYVRNVKQMDFLFNPMYLAWLFEKNRRKWCKYNTIVLAPFSFVFGLLLSYIAFNGWKLVTQSDLALDSFGSLGLMIIGGLCWYEGICKPNTESGEDDATDVELDDAEKEESFKYD